MGLGQLTNIGKTQHNKNIYVRSTDKDRTIASAMCNLAGIYPPSGDQIWEKSIKWQPIPVHTVAAYDDWLLGGNLPSCPVHEKALDVCASADVQNIIKENSSQIDYLFKNAGEDVKSDFVDMINDIAKIRDSFLIETIYKKP